MDLEAIEEGAVRLSVPTRFLKSWIQSHYAERVLACWQAQEGKVTRVELIVRSAVLKSAMLPKAKPRPRGREWRPLYEWPRQWPAAVRRRPERA